jgi:hypothetical protein
LESILGEKRNKNQEPIMIISVSYVKSPKRETPYLTEKSRNEKEKKRLKIH